MERRCVRRPGGRYVRVGAYFRGDSIAAQGERSAVWFRHDALPPAVAEAYYRHMTGLEVVHALPGKPFESGGLPAKIDVWLRADQIGGRRRKKLDAIGAGLSAVADPATPPRADKLGCKSFACVLDTRAQDATHGVVSTCCSCQSAARRSACSTCTTRTSARSA